MTKNNGKGGGERHHAIAFLALGTNLGDKAANIHEAVRRIGEKAGKVIRLSSLLETEPWGFDSENSFVNAAVSIETMLTPRQLLLATQEIERDMGRKVKSCNGVYHDRIIDIDILTYGDEVINDEDLVIPHPHMEERDFVMIPYNEIKTIMG